MKLCNLSFSSRKFSQQCWFLMQLLDIRKCSHVLKLWDQFCPFSLWYPSQEWRQNQFHVEIIHRVDLTCSVSSVSLHVFSFFFFYFFERKGVSQFCVNFFGNSKMSFLLFLSWNLANLHFGRWGLSFLCQVYRFSNVSVIDYNMGNAKTWNWNSCTKVFNRFQSCFHFRIRMSERIHILFWR